MKKLLYILILALSSHIVLAKSDVEGYWMTIDDETNEAQSIVQVYEYQGKYFGRVVALLDDEDATADLPGSPKIKGMDIIWDLEADDGKYTGGEILDPAKGKVYGCELWRDEDKLIVRGKIAFFGRNQTWLSAKDFKGDPTPLVPQKPKLK